MVIYEFDNVPVKIEGYMISPQYNLVSRTKSLDVNKWISYLVEFAEGSWPIDRAKNPALLTYYILWNTGWGNFFRESRNI